MTCWRLTASSLSISTLLHLLVICCLCMLVVLKAGTSNTNLNKPRLWMDELHLLFAGAGAGV